MDEIKAEMNRKKAILEESLQSPNENIEEQISEVVESENLESTNNEVQETVNISDEQTEKISENIE